MKAKPEVSCEYCGTPLAFTVNPIKREFSVDRSCDCVNASDEIAIISGTKVFQFICDIFGYEEEEEVEC